MTHFTRFLLITVLFFTNLQVFGQNMEWSNARKLKGNEVFTSVLGENSHGIYLLRYRNKFFTKNIIIERYRHQMGFALAKNIVLKKSRLLHIELQENRLLMISVRFNRKQMQNEVVKQWFDHNLEPIDEPSVVIVSSLSDYYDKGDFRVRTSNDNKLFVLLHTEKSVNGKRLLCVNYFNDSMQPLKSKRWELNMEYDAFAMHDIMMDNEGNTYFLTNNHELAKKRNSAVPLDWKLFWFQYQQDSLMDFQMTDSGYNLSGPIFSWDRFNNKVNITAFYTVDGQIDLEGIYNYSLYPNHPSSSKAVYRKFDDHYKGFLSEDQLPFGLDELRNFKILDVIPNSDGGLSIVAERSSFTFESDITYINGVPQTVSRNIYNYDDVLVLCVDAGLKIRWDHLINKSQSSLNDGGYFSSIIIANTRSKLYIIYNDRLRTNGDVIQYSFTPQGEVNNKILIRSGEDFVSVIPGEARQIAYNKLILPVSKDKKFSLLKLEYSN